MSIVEHGAACWLFYLLLQSVAASDSTLKIRRDTTMAGSQLAAPQGFIHTVVGADGVIRIRGKTFNQHADEALQAVGIVATDIPATDEASVSDDDLAKGCLSKSDAHAAHTCSGQEHLPASKWGDGCSTKAEQATAESFRRALLAAAARKNEWTLILEDDVAPVGFKESEEWNESFRQLWESLPKEGRSVCFVLVGVQHLMPTKKKKNGIKLSKLDAFSS